MDLAFYLLIINKNMQEYIKHHNNNYVLRYKIYIEYCISQLYKKKRHGQSTIELK